MPKTFITERDVDDMQTRGLSVIDVNDNVVMTDLARERAARYGIRVNRVEQAAPKATFSPSVNLAVSSVHTMASRPTLDDELKARVRSAVLARLDRQVDVAVLDAIITRVINSMK